MSSGKFILSVRIAGAVAFGILSAGDDQRFDEASREKRHRRDAVLEFVKARRDNWTKNYKPYADASFRIEEFDNETGELKVVSGVPYDRPTDLVGTVCEHLTKAAHNVSGRHRRTAEALSDHLFMLGADGDLPTDVLVAWENLPLDVRVTLAREVAVGLFTPAVVS